MHVQVERIQKRDFDAVFTLLRTSLPDFGEIDAENFRRDFEKNFREHEQDTHYFVARHEDGRVLGLVGYGRENLSADTYYLGWFVVDVSVQRSGIGDTLLQRVEKELIQGGRARQLIVREWDQGANDPAARFYVKNGFEKIAVLPEYWDDWADMAIYRKRFKASQKQSAGNRSSLAQNAKPLIS